MPYWQRAMMVDTYNTLVHSLFFLKYFWYNLCFKKDSEQNDGFLIFSVLIFCLICYFLSYGILSCTNLPPAHTVTDILGTIRYDDGNVGSEICIRELRHVT